MGSGSGSGDALQTAQGAKARIKGLKSWWEERNRYHHECKRCGHKWNGYKARPDKCPRCSDKDWDKDGERVRKYKQRGKLRGRQDWSPITAVGIDLDLKNGLQKVADGQHRIPALGSKQYNGSLTDVLRDILEKVGVPRVKTASK